MLVDGYLGDLNNIPHNVIFKIRTSHDLVNIPAGGHAKIKFKRGTDETEYTLRKYISGSLQPLENYNYTSGNVYDIYINSQDIAIITANDTWVEALDAVTSLADTVSDYYNTLDNKIDTSLQTAKDYTDGKDTTMNGRVSTLETKINPIFNCIFQKRNINSLKLSQYQFNETTTYFTDSEQFLLNFLNGIANTTKLTSK